MMGFVQRKATTGKVTILVGAQKEAESKIVNQVDKYQVPPSLVINFDQTQSKYIQVSSNTVKKKGVTNVSILMIRDLPQRYFI